MLETECTGRGVILEYKAAVTGLVEISSSTCLKFHLNSRHEQARYEDGRSDDPRSPERTPTRTRKEHHVLLSFICN